MCWQPVMSRQKKDLGKSTRGKKREVKRCMYQSKKKVYEQFGRKMNEDVNGNMKWKVVCNVKGGRVESCSRI